MMENWGSRIREEREKRGLKPRELGEMVGANQQDINRIERGETRNSKYLPKILSVLDLTPRQPTLLPVVGYVGGGQEVLAIDDHMLGDGIDHIEAPPGVENGIALIVRGNSMAPKYEDGDIVVVEKIFLDMRSLLGRTCYVKLADGRCYLKTLAGGSRPGRYSLLSAQGPSIPDVVIEQAYPVAWVKPRR